MKNKELTENNFGEGDIIKYKNTQGNICEALITGFRKVRNGKMWFSGYDLKTKADVFRPMHISIKLENLNLKT